MDIYTNRQKDLAMEQVEELKSEADDANTAAVFFIGIALALLATNVVLVIALFVALARG